MQQLARCTRVDRKSTQLASTSALAALLVAASISCFFTAFYLATVLPEGQLESVERAHLLPILAPEDSLASNRSSLGFYGLDTDKKYLAYLPHSGFHNQRIAFENGLVLARMLNRTLIVPPVRLGVEPIPYSPFDELLEQLRLSDDKAGSVQCLGTPWYLTVRPECSDLDPPGYTHVAWNSIVDLSSVEVEQPLHYIDGFNYPWLLERSPNDTEIFVLKDNNTYDYRFIDYPPPSTGPALSRYNSSLQINTLSRSPEKLIQIGTLFGSTRLHLKVPVNKKLRKSIRERMVFSNPLLLRAAHEVAGLLGATYLGAHIRIGSGHFQHHGTYHARAVWYKLLQRVLGFSLGAARAMELELDASSATLPCPSVLLPDWPAIRTPHAPLPPLLGSSRLPCRRPLHTSPELMKLNVPLFISTDSPEPDLDPALQLFLDSFPCTFFLSDFLRGGSDSNSVDELLEMGVGSLSVQPELDALINPRDKRSLRPFLEPFLDAMVVSHAWGVAGTDGSTFSRFVEDVLWRRYHGWEIVQRG